MADEKKMVTGENLQAGDALIGIASSGVHSNGFSLVRKVFNINDEKKVGLYIDELGHTLGEELITPTKIYVKAVKALMSVCDVHAMSHITGGGFYENIPRMMKDGTRAHIEKSKLVIPPIFKLISNEGISEHDMFNTFNMGTGIVAAVPSDKADEAVRAINEAGEKAAVIGEVLGGEKGVEIC